MRQIGGSLHLQNITLDGSLQSGNLGLSLNSIEPRANFTLQLDGDLLPPRHQYRYRAGAR